MNQGSLEKTLRSFTRRGRVLTSPAQLAGYDTDGLGYKSYRPDAVVIPADSAELQLIVEQSRHLKIPLIMRGAGTSLSGGPVAVQGGIVVHTSALRAVRQICPAGFWCEVECSVTLSQLEQALKPYGLFYPPDPSSGPVCTIGGNVAMNAGGAHCFRYGVTSNYVLGVEAILLDGSLVQFGGPAGGRGAWLEDWKRLFIGSEGTLGAFTRFWLRVLPLPEKIWTFRATFADLRSAERAIHELVNHAALPVAIELMDPRCVDMVENSPVAVGLPKNSYMLLTEIDGPRELVDVRVDSIAKLLQAAGSHDVVFTADSEQRDKLWKARKAAGGLMGQLSADLVVQDAVIPKRYLEDLLQLVYTEADAAGIPVVNVFHAGDGNLHPNFLFDSRNPGELEKVERISKRFMQRVVEVGGTLSGEHGIGNDKSPYMPLVFSPRATRVQLAVPSVFNPDHRLNPMKVFEQRRFQASKKSSDHGDLSNQQPSKPLLGSSEFDENSPTAPHESPHSSARTSVRDDRCFVDFIDPVDGVMCFPATTCLASVNAIASPHKLRFPLVLDSQVSLDTQLSASGYASASSRFGALCDNILGMNWQLPDGEVIRIGERVAKTTTGYDLLRFLLHAPGRYGNPLNYVVRLRPDCGKNGVFYFSSPDFSRLRIAAMSLFSQCWLHWLDAIDLLAESSTERRLRVAVHGSDLEWKIWQQFLEAYAAEHDLQLHAADGASTINDGCPDLTIKTVADRVFDLSDIIARRGDFRVVSLCYCGVIHCYATEATGDRMNTALRSTVQSLLPEVLAVGGDFQSRHIPLTISDSPVEQDWIQRFIRAADLK